MSKSAVVIPFRPRRARIDLAMALARLSKGVRAHEEAVRRARLAFLRRITLLPVPSPEHAKSLGA
jgi:hypothetical protein